MRKLTKEQAEEIRALCAANPKLKKNAVGRLYGVAATVISAITLGQIHRDVDQDVKDALARLKGKPTSPAPSPIQKPAPKATAAQDTEVSRLTREVYILKLEMAQLQGVVEQLRGSK